MHTMRALFLLAAMTQRLAAQSIGELVLHQVKADTVEYLGKRALRITEKGNVPNAEAYAVVKGAPFHNGSIELELAGKPAVGAVEGARGFIGMAFRLRGGEYEYIYLRPTNGRADDQVRRNHSTQYSSYPRFDFAESRRVAPEKYESYVDLEPGAWTKYRITVEGTKARLYVNGAAQPCLIVNDLKLGDAIGDIALWIGPGTEGYFANLVVQRR
jgi:hypothetical protein